jgi:uracil-DNA glycosylase
MHISLPSSWQSALSVEVDTPYFHELMEYIKYEYSQYNCFPQESSIFRALDIVPFEQVKVVILGQDPYHTPGAAM